MASQGTGGGTASAPDQAWLPGFSPEQEGPQGPVMSLTGWDSSRPMAQLNIPYLIRA